MSLLESALKLSDDRGWEIFPATRQKKSFKNAMTSNGRRWGATRDPDEIARDFEKFPRANVGLPTGKNNGIFVVDADTLAGHGKDGLGTMKKLQRKHGTLPDTLVGISPTGSRHWFFQYPLGMVIRNSTDKLGTGVDVRGEGGMVIAAPSKTKDGVYRWEDPAAEVAEAPQWLIDAVATTQNDLMESEVDWNNQRPLDDDELQAAVDAIPNGEDIGWEEWNRVGLAIWSATQGSDRGLRLFDEWSARWEGAYDAAYTKERWEDYTRSPPDRIGVGTLLWLANDGTPGWRKLYEARAAVQHMDRAATEEQIVGGVAEIVGQATDQEADVRDAQARSGGSGVKLTDFWAIMEEHKYVYTPTGRLWPQASLSRLGSVPLLDRKGKPIKDEDGKITEVKAWMWLDVNRSVEQIVWVPGKPQIIHDTHLKDGGWVRKSGIRCFNGYVAPDLPAGDAAQAQMWLDHVRFVYPAEAEHIIDWFAYHVQHPGEKVNHSLVFLGEQGTGKDTIIEPLKYAVGHWNFKDVSPHDILGAFNSYQMCVILRINEGRDLGDVNRYQFYERTKVLMAAPPDVIRVNEKYQPEKAVINCCGVIITTNNKDALYLPPDDRRHFVAYTTRTRADYDEGYWKRMWEWYFAGGFAHVVALLRTRDLSHFDPKAPPIHTEAFMDIVATGRDPNTTDMSSTLMAMGDPPAVTLRMVEDGAGGAGPSLGSFYEWLTDRKNFRIRGRLLVECGYALTHNPTNSQGLWTIQGERTAIYAKSDQTQAERLRSAQALVRSLEQPTPPAAGAADQRVGATVTPIGGRRTR